MKILNSSKPKMKFFFFRNIEWMILFICLLCLLGSCSKPTFTSKKGITILDHTGGEQINKERMAIVQQFNALHPDTPATIEFLGNEFYTVLQTRIVGGAAPDVLLWMDASKIKAFQEKDQMLDLSPYVDADTTFNVSDYNEALLNRVRINGKLFGLISEASMMVLFYNKDLFDKAGVSYPDDTWTWDTFMKACGKLSKFDKSGQTSQFATIPFVWYPVWIPTVWQNDGDLFSQDLSHCTMNDPNAYEAIQYIADMMLKYKVAPRPTATSMNFDQEFNNLFLSGRIAMMPTGAWMVNMLDNNKKFRWGVASLPKGRKRVTFLDGTYCSIMKTTQNPQVAYDFLKFWCGASTELYRVRQHEIVPVLKSVLASPEFLNFAGSENARKVFSDTFDYGRITPIVPNSDEIQDLMIRSLDRVWTGDAKAKEVCTELSPKVDALLKNQRTP